jgi:hypothetical protein
MWSNASFANVSHPPLVASSPEPHGGECRGVVGAQRLDFPQATESSFLMRFERLPGPLTCPDPRSGPVTCIGSFPGLFGQDGVTLVRASNVTFPAGRVEGKLEVNSPVAPFSANFSGAVVRP